MKVSLSEIHSIHKQDARVQKEIFCRLYPALVAACKFYVADEMMAEDAVTTAFIKAFKHPEKFKYLHDTSFFAWLKRISIREILMQIRNRREFLSIGDVPEDQFADEMQENEWPDMDAILRILSSLKPVQRAVFLLICMEDYSHAEVAEELGISEDNSKQLYRRSKLKIRQLFTQENKLKYGKLGN